MRASKQQQKGAIGTHEVAAKFEKLGWGTAENTHHDLGTDLYLTLRDKRLFELGVIAGAQVKAGDAKYFREPVTDIDGTVTGWWYRESHRDHFDYWTSHHAPHFLVLHDIDKDLSYWVRITRDAVTYLKKGAKILVPASQTLDDAAPEALLDAALSGAERRDWQGSSWTGAVNLSPTERLRHALLAPRLVAPHPNLSVKTPTAVQALAMVVLRRSTHEFIDLAPSRPARKRGEGSDWEWDFVGGLDRAVNHADLDELRALTLSARAPHEQAAATAVLAALTIENDDASEALKLTDRLLARDRLNALDHAWITLHRARANFELGAHEAVRKTTFALIPLRDHFSHDVTAAAISGGAASLLFAAADWDQLDFGATISALDTTASWWRHQLNARGLEEQTREAFEVWAETGRSTLSDDNAWTSLRAASLTASFTGDHRSWSAALRLLARYVLTSAAHGETHTQQMSALRTARVSGAADDVSAAATRLATYGSGKAVREVVEDLDLRKASVTSLPADLALLASGGDLLSSGKADRACDWAIEVLRDPTVVASRLHAQFDVQSRVADLLASLVPALSPDHADDLLDEALGIDLETPGLSAGSMRKLILAFPAEAWSASRARLALARAQADPPKLKYALLKRCSSVLSEVRVALEKEALEDFEEPLWALGSVTKFDPDFASALISRVTAGPLDASCTTPWAHTAGHALALTLLNVWHPSSADWPALLAILNSADPDAELASTLDRLVVLSHHLPLEVTEDLEMAALRLSELPQPEEDRLFQPRDFRPASRQLRALLHHRREGGRRPGLLLELVRGSRDDRQAATFACLGSEEFELGLLTALACDQDPHVRATAASVAVHRAATAVNERAELLALMSTDPSLLVQRYLASSAAEHPVEGVLRDLAHLHNSISARARRDLRRAEDSLGSVRDSHQPPSL